MRQSRRQGLTAEAAAAAVEQPSDAEMAAVAAAVDAWVAQRISKGRPPARLGLLWFLLFRCNSGRTMQVTLLAIAFMAFRIGNNLFFSLYMSVLGDDVDSLVLISSMPSVALAVSLYVIAALGSSTLNYLLDQGSKHLGNQIRMQVVWCVQAATLRATQAAAAPFPSSEVVSLAGMDAMAVEWAIWMLPYALVIPVEIIVLILLSVTAVGGPPTAYAMVPLVLSTVLKLVLVKVAGRQQAKAREVQAQRLDMLSESIQSNSVVKLMGTEKETLDAMAGLRRREQRLLGWLSFSNAFSLYTQSVLATMMAWLAMVIRAEKENLFSSSSVMTVLGFYRTIANYDLYRITTAIQNLTVASNSLQHHYALLEAAARASAAADADADGTDAMREMDSGGSKDLDVPLKDELNHNVPLVDLKDAVFSWNLDGDDPTLTGLTFALPHGKLVGVAGPIGSGKSTLLLALLGELQQCEGTVEQHPDWHRPVAYMPQRHWLQTGTLRNNVCYASPESPVGPDWVDRVVEACGMTRDVADFPDGLDHFIGEGGTSLSGGQRARVSLARAVHAAAAITVLDDPLCALDPGLGAEVFRRTMGPGGLLRGPGRSVILVTTNPAMLTQCDVVAVVRDGTVAAVAPPAQLSPGVLDFELPKVDKDVIKRLNRIQTAKESRKAATVKRCDTIELGLYDDHVEAAWAGDDHDATLALVRQGDGAGGVSGKDAEPEVDASSEADDDGSALLKGVDVKRRGRMSALMAMLGWTALLAGVLLVASQGLVFYWSMMVQDGLDGTHSMREFRGLESISRWMVSPIAVTSSVGAFLHFFSFLWGSTTMQNRCGAAVLASPYSFFSVNPASKIFGAISADSQLVELSLSVSMGAMWSLTAQLVGTVVLSIYALWYLVFLFLPLAAVYGWIQRTYSACVTPFARAEAAARSPVSAAVATTLEGLPVIRAFRCQSASRADLSTAIAGARGTSLAVINAAGWLAFVSNVFIFNSINIVVAIAIAFALKPGPNSLGPIVMSNVSSLSSIIGSAAMLISNVEIALTSLQRLCMFSELPSEDAVVRHPSPELVAHAAAAVKEAGGPDSNILIQNAEEEPPEGWPSTGSISYRRVYASYVWGTPPALKGVTIEIPAGSSCALVGRSGSGKSTAFLTLTGMIPIISGAVEIDCVAVEHVPLKTLRAALAVVPQQPVLFAGSLRANLDPHSQHGDSALWESLRAVGLNEAVTAAGGLAVDPLAAGMSQGQRQLLCLARALLRDCSILLLDEANASLDAATERQMAATVAAFGAGELTVVTGAAPRRRTVVEVAHRLEGVMGMDQVVVLGAGAVLESGPPRELAKKSGGEFAGMLSSGH